MVGLISSLALKEPWSLNPAQGSRIFRILWDDALNLVLNETWVKFSSDPQEAQVASRVEGYLRHAHEELHGDLDGVLISVEVRSDLLITLSLLEFEDSHQQLSTTVAFVGVTQEDYSWSAVMVPLSQVERFKRELPNLHPIE